MLFLTSLNAIKSIGPLGTDDGTKTDEFWENFERGGGGGVIFNPKIYVADFGPLDRAF